MTQSDAIKMLAEWLAGDLAESPGYFESEARRRYLDMVQANVAAIAGMPGVGIPSCEGMVEDAIEFANTTIQSLHDGAKEAGKP